VLVIFCQDLGRHVGCYGVETVDTPAVDGLAESGVRFEQSLAVAPLSSPSRASAVTGRYPHSNGVMGVTHGNAAWDLDEDEHHLAELLRAQGYSTALSGPSHEMRTPEDAFQEVRTRHGACEALAQDVRDCLDRQANTQTPFYLQVSFFEPHRAPRSDTGFGSMPPGYTPEATVPPYLVDDERAREEIAAFEGAVTRVDTATGRILDRLEATEQADNTIVVLASDHGIPFPRAKCSPYDPGIESSLILRGPSIARGDTRSELVSSLDLVPTLLDLIDAPTPVSVQGQSFAPLLTGGSAYTPREAVFGELTYHDYCDPRRWIRTQNQKLVVNFSSTRTVTDPTETWRPETTTVEPAAPMLTRTEPLELYDLEADPSETQNLADASSHDAVRRELLTRLNRWMQEMDDPLLDGVPPSPMHERACATLRDGVVPTRDESRQ